MQLFVFGSAVNRSYIKPTHHAVNASMDDLKRFENLRPGACSIRWQVLGDSLADKCLIGTCNSRLPSSNLKSSLL